MSDISEIIEGVKGQKKMEDYNLTIITGATDKSIKEIHGSNVNEIVKEKDRIASVMTTSHLKDIINIDMVKMPDGSWQDFFGNVKTNIQNSILESIDKYNKMGHEIVYIYSGTKDKLGNIMHKANAILEAELGNSVYCHIFKKAIKIKKINADSQYLFVGQLELVGSGTINYELEDKIIIPQRIFYFSSVLADGR